MQNNKQRILTEKRGVTMMALAITVIVLLILGSVALAISLNHDGLFNRAKQSKEQYANTVASEGEKLAEAYKQKSLEIIGTIEDGETSESGNKLYNDGKDIAVIPKGFTVSGIDGEKKVEDGLVIYQTNGETVDDWDEAKTKYSQWVWIPVDNVEEMFNENSDGVNLTGSTGIRTNFYSKTTTLGSRTLSRTTPGNTSGFREPDIVLGDNGTSYDYANYASAGFSSLKDMADGLSNDYREMINSIKKYGGFYVGRYELSGSVSNPKLKPGESVLTNTDWYNLYKACKQFGKSNEAIETRMIWGNQWDAICKFINTSGDKVNLDNSSTYGNYSNSASPANVSGYGSKQNTGYSEKWKTNNIYDLAGNNTEWTQEASISNKRGYRGGTYEDNGSNKAVINKADGEPINNYYCLSTRPTLYIKDNKVQEEKPVIIEAEVKSSTSHSIKVEVTGRLAEEYEFYYKKNGDSNYTKAETIKANTNNYNEKETIEYEFDDLTKSTGYSFKIVLKNSNGQVEKEITGQTTKAVDAPTITVLEADKYTKEKQITISESNTYRLKYTTDGSTPSQTNGKDYTGIFVVDKDCTIKAGYFDSRWQIGEVATATVTKIDRINPVITSNLTVTASTTNSSNVTMTITDTYSGLCKIEWYRKLSTDEVYTLVETSEYATLNGTVAGATTAQTKIYTYEDLTQTKTYNFKAVAYDVAGNKVESYSSNNGNTETVTTLAINAGTTNWQNSGTKTITITADNSNYAKIKYTTDGSLPGRNNGTEIASGGTFTVNSNCTIKAIAFDSTWQEGTTATATVTRFDFIAPTINSSLAVTATTTNSTSVTVTVADSNTGSNSGLWKTEWYYKLKTDSNWTKHGSDEIESGITKNGTATGPTTARVKTHTFTNLTQTKEYDFKVVVTDAAGNSNESTKSNTTYTVTTLNITIANANDWKTNKNVTITASNNNYTKIVYTTDGSTPAVNANGSVKTGTQISSGGSFNITANNTVIKAIAFDSTNQEGTTATAIVTKIDRNAPTLTSYEVKNVGYYGYDVYVYGVTDNSECGVNRVQFPTWTSYNGQDDLVSDYENNTAIKGTDLGNGTWYFRVNTSDHKNESGHYITHIYLFDNLGNRAGAFGLEPDVPEIPTLTYTIANSNPNTWQTSKQVTINASNNNYSKIVYTTDGTVPSVNENGTITNGLLYSNPFNITTNNTTIKAYAFDNTYSPNTLATTTVTNVESTKPVINTALGVTSTTTNSATVSIRATDALSGFSQVEWYYKENGASSWIKDGTTTDKALHSTTAGVTSAVTKTYTYENLTQTKTYNFMARVYDVAGNYIDSSDNGTTLTVTTLTITIDNANTWRTNKNVIITANNSNYKTIVYTIDGSTPAVNADGSVKTGTAIQSGEFFNVNVNNTTVKAIAFDSTNQAGTTATALVTKVDTSKPVINTVTASDTLDIASFVDFNAEDGGSGIVGYNITTTDNEPTTWIPVVSTVEESTETTYMENAAWARVFHHNSHWGNVYYENSSNAQSSNTIDKYSVLGNIANYKNSSNWEFLLQYPQVSLTQYNRWTQTSNPVTTNNSITGYNAISNSWTSNSFGGIALSSNSGSTFIDGSPGVGSWYYAIGSYKPYGGGIPGSDDDSGTYRVSVVNLWSRIDNLSTTSSADLTRRIGDLKENTTYYVWVKDEVGYTEKKAITVGNVDRTAPTASITSTNNVATTQTATLSMGDNNGVVKYYFGKSNPGNNDVSWTTITSATSTAPTATVDSEGTWYLGVQDAAGNRTVTSKTFYKTSLTPNRGSVTPTYVITLAGNSFNLPTPTAVVGYTWGGWYKESSLSTSAGTNYTPAGNTILYGKWTANTYTVAFNPTGGTTPTANKNVTYDSTYGDLPNPSRTGYTFDGWYANLVKAVKFEDEHGVDATQSGAYVAASTYMATPDLIPIKAGATLYSNIAICGIYTYDSNKNFIKRESVYTSTHPISSNAAYIRIEIKKDAGDFNYYLNNLVISEYQNAGDISYVSTAMTSSVVNKIPSNHSLYAKWTPITYTITYDLAGGSISGQRTTYTIETPTFTIPEPTKTGFTFEGWTGSNGSTPSKTVTIPIGSIGNKSYTAHWGYYVEIYGSGLNQTTKQHKVMIADAQANTSAGRGLTLVKFNKVTGAVIQTASYDTYADDSKRTEIANIINDSTTNELIALFSQDATAWNTNLKTALQSVGIPSDRIYYANSAGRYPTAVFVGKGLTSSQASIVEAFTEEYAPTSYIKVYVKDGVPQRETYSISYNLNGGTLPSAYPTYYTASDSTFSLTAPTREGYTFLGWTGSNGTTAQTSVSIAKGSTGDKVYTANWQINQYTVTYEDWFVDGNNGRQVKLGSSTESINYGTAVSGADKGTDTTISKYYYAYQYKSCTSGTVPANNNLVVYRYFWAWSNVNILNPEGVEKGDSSVATFSASYNGGTYVTNKSNEDAVTVPYNGTIRIKDLTLKQNYYALDSVKWGSKTNGNAGTAVTPTDGVYTVTVTDANLQLNIITYYKTFTISLNNQSATSAGTTAIYEKYNTGYYLNSNNTNQMSTSANGITTPTRSGYTFKGYYTGTNGGGTQYIDANGKLTSSASTTNFSADGSLYAYWVDDIAPSKPTVAGKFTSDNGNYTSGDWVNREVYTTITSTDEGTGVNKIQYSTNGTSGWTDLTLAKSNGVQKSGTSYSGSEAWTVTNNRQITLYFRTVDASGNPSPASDPITIRYDTQKPTAPTLSNATNGNWTNANIQVNATSTDDESGVDHYECSYSDSGNTFVNVNIPDTWYNARNETVSYRAVDKAGNISDASSTTIRIDKTAPTIETAITKTSAATTNSQAVSVTAKDVASGFAKVEWWYKKGTGSWVKHGETSDHSLNTATSGVVTNVTKTYTFTGLDQNSSYNYMARVYDVAGNYTDSSTDGTTPAVTTLTITVSNASDWKTNKDVTITAANSNYSKIVYTTDGTTPSLKADGTVNNGTAITSGSSFNVTANCTVKAIAFDSTNQSGATASASVTKIDRDAPTYTSAEIKNLSSTGYDVYVYGVTDNSGSGVNRLQFPTWTDANGQDDIQSSWSTNTSAKGTLQSDGTTWVYRVNTTDHKNESGLYHTHVYLYDNLGNYRIIGTSGVTDNVTVPTVAVTFDNNFLENNLLTNTSRVGSYSAAATAPSAKVEVEDETASNGYYIEFTMNSGTGGGPYYIPPSRLTQGKTYTWSVEVKASKNITLCLGQEQGGHTNYTSNVTTEWQRYTYTFTANNYSNYAFVFYKNFSSDTWTSGDKLYVKNLYLAETSSLNATTSNKTYNNQLGTLAEPTRAGYTFDGWYTEPTGGTEISSTTTVPSSDVTYYAHWTANKYYIDTNQYLDGVYSYGGNELEPYGSIDYYVNGVKRGTGINGIWSRYYYGSTYEINNITAKPGRTYVGLYEGSSPLSGIITEDGVNVIFVFTSNTINLTLNNQSATSAGTANAYYKYGTDTYYSNSDLSTALTNNKITVPTKRGYTFGGYYTSTNGGGTQYINASGEFVNNPHTAITADTTLYAKWTAKKLTIIYNKNDGTTTSSSETFTYDGNMDDNYLSPASGMNSRTGYTFAGWSMVADGSDNLRYPYNDRIGDNWFINQLGTSSEKTVNFYAQWTANTYTVAYNGNGATGGSTASSSHTYDVAKNLTANGFTRAYSVTYNYNGATGGNSTASNTATYSFNGWNTASNGSGTNYSNSQSVTNLSSTNGATFNLYAKWTSASVTLPTPTRTGYTFNGWYDAATGGNKIGNGGASYTPTANKELFAQWTAATQTNKIAHWTWGYTNGEGNNGNKTAYHLQDTTFTAKTEDTYKLSADKAVSIPNGFYLQSGFGTSAISGSWTNYTGWDTTITQNPGEMVFEYDYYPNTYNITYTLNGGTNNSSNPSTYNVLYGVTFADPSRTGYTFAGWTIGGTSVTGINSGANASFTSASDLYDKLSTRTTGDKTVVANWTPNKYTVTFNFNGGTLRSPSSVSEFITSSTVDETYDAKYTLPTSPTRPGYTFAGWYTDATNGTQVTTNTTVAITAAQTLYAHWTVQSYTLTVNPNGGTWSNSTTAQTFTQNYNTTKTIANPTRDGYAFKGWVLTKTIDSANYVELMYQAPTFGGFTNEAGAKSANTLYTYSQLGQLANFTYNSKYDFIIQVDENNTMYKWSQTSNPLTTTSVTGYTNISNGFGGLVYNNTATLLAVSTSGNNWWNAIGMYGTGTNPIGSSLWTNRPVHFYVKAANDLSNLSAYTITGALNGSNNYIFRDENVTLQAIWQQSSYTISYDLAGGSLASGVTNPTSYTSTSSAITLNNPTRTGYTFAGWTGSNGTTPQTTVTIASGSTGNKSYTANWTPKIFKHTLNANGGSGGTTAIWLKYGSGWYSDAACTNKITSVTIPTRTGYTLTGYTHSGGTTNWIDSSGNIVVNNWANSVEDITLYAQWTVNQYTLTVNPNGGTYNSTTSNSTYTQDYGTYKQIGTATPPASATITFNGNGGTSASASATSSKSFSGWTKSGTGEYRSESTTSNDGISRSTRTENGETYHRFTYSASSPTSDRWFSTGYPAYSYTSGHTYEIRFKVRVNSVANGGNIAFRHGRSNNDWVAPAVKGYSAVTNGWEDVTLTATFSGTTYDRSGSAVTIAPCFEAWTGNLKDTTASMSFDVKDLMIIDVTTDTLLQSNTNMFWFREGNGTLTANYSAYSQVTLPNATRSGYEFLGWYDASSGGNKIGDAGAKYTPTGSKILYAQWKQKYSITCNLNGGTGGGAPTEVYSRTYNVNSSGTAAGQYDNGMDVTDTVTVAGASQLTVDIYYDTESTSYDWVTVYEGSGSSPSTSNDATISTSTGNISGKLAGRNSGRTTSYTSWYHQTYTINADTVKFHFKTDGSAVYYGYYAIVRATGTTTYYDVDSNAITLVNPTRTGYTFTGWSGTGLSGSANTSVTIPKGSTGNRSYTANWSVNTFTMDLNGWLDGASSGGLGSYGTADVYLNGSLVSDDTTDYYNTSVSYGTTYEIKDIKAKSGYTYNGVHSGSLSGTVTGYTSMYLDFTTNSYTATFNGNGGSNGTSITTKYGSALGTLPSSSRTGYTFAGWYTASSGGSQISSSTTMPLNGTTYYAHWTANTITLTLNKNGGSGGTTTVYYKYNTNTFYSNSACTSQITSISVPTRTGYTFSGYVGDGTCGGNSGENYITSSGSFQSDLNYDIYKNATLTAQWTANTIHVTLNKNGGSGGTSEFWFKYGTNKLYSNSACTSQITSISRPSKSGYTFNGYYGNGSSGGDNGEGYIKSDGTWYGDLCEDIYKDATLSAGWTSSGSSY